jgi:hypothetical protein
MWRRVHNPLCGLLTQRFLGRCRVRFYRKRNVDRHAGRSSDGQLDADDRATATACPDVCDAIKIGRAFAHAEQAMGLGIVGALARYADAVVFDFQHDVVTGQGEGHFDAARLCMLGDVVERCGYHDLTVGQVDGSGK